MNNTNHDSNKICLKNDDFVGYYFPTKLLQRKLSKPFRIELFVRSSQFYSVPVRTSDRFTNADMAEILKIL